MYNPNAPQYTVFKVKEPSELLPFIIRCLNGISRSKAKAILSGSGIRVDRKIVTQHDFLLEPGMTVEISKRTNASPLVSRVIEKNIGILSMATDHHQFCVKTILDDYFRKSRQKCTAHVVHRLDRDTSGLLVYAKTIEAEQILEHNWHTIVTDRRYVALASGRMEREKGTVESWLKDNKAYFTFSSPVDNGGKYAVTHFRTLRSNDYYSLVELKLETGRKNQIRVHLQDLGHPVCGDIKYGNGDDPCGRLCLHAFRLDFYHPITGEHLHFETPMPKPFLHAMKDAEKTENKITHKQS